MARTEEADLLRACPTCSTKVSAVQMGLRDYSSWLAEHMPGRVSGADIDCVLEQSRTGRVLFFEFKRKGQQLPTGQRLLVTAGVGRTHVLPYVELQDEIREVLLCHQETVGHAGPRRADDGAIDDLVIRGTAELLPAIECLAVEQRFTGVPIRSPTARGHEQQPTAP